MSIMTEFGKANIGNHGYYQIVSNNSFHLELLHRLIYKKYNGEIPKGYVIHHIDGDKLNNNINNLKLVSLSEHSINHNTGSKRTVEMRYNMRNAKLGKSNKSNSSGYYRVYKEKGNQYSQGFTWCYQVDESRLEGKKQIIRIRRVNLNDLERVVKEKEYEWRKLE